MVLFSVGQLNVLSIEPNYILQIFNTGDYPVLISDNHNILFENFTATWCGWCHFSYEIFDSLMEKYGKQIINIRYHNQDTLAMSNINDRSSFYKVNGFPTMVFNGNKKIVGADETTYPVVETLVASLLEQQAKLGVYTSGYIDGRLIRLTSVIQSFSKETITGNFLTVFSESNVIFQKDRRYDFVSRSVFPNFQGIKLSIEPGKIYMIQYSKLVADENKILDFEAVSLIQNFDTKEIYNSCAFQMDSLIISKSNPLLFMEDVKRDAPIILEFQEGLVLGSIDSAEMMIVSNLGELIFLDPVYDRIKKTLTLYPLKLLKPLTGYYFLILGGEDSLLSINKKRLKTDVIIPFHTSQHPDLSLEASDLEINFGDVFDIDFPEKILKFEEKKGNNLRFKFNSSAKWIECSESIIFGSMPIVSVKANTLHMHPGINKGNLVITTILGNTVIPVYANLLSNEYPQIRFFDYFPTTAARTIFVSGRTNGYRMFVGSKEIFVDNDGYFNIKLSLEPGYNFCQFQAINMQRKVSNKILVFYRFLIK